GPRSQRATIAASARRKGRSSRSCPDMGSRGYRSRALAGEARSPSTSILRGGPEAGHAALDSLTHSALRLPSPPVIRVDFRGAGFPLLFVCPDDKTSRPRPGTVDSTHADPRDPAAPILVGRGGGVLPPVAGCARPNRLFPWRWPTTPKSSATSTRSPATRRSTR